MHQPVRMVKNVRHDAPYKLNPVQKEPTWREHLVATQPANGLHRE